MPQIISQAYEREDWLDWLRGLAAVGVVIFHINQVRIHTGDWYDHITSLGWLGVPVFFFVSGYCIYLTVARSPSWSDFLFRRLLRIYPPYLASLAIVCLVVLWRVVLTGANDVTPVPHSLPALIATLSLLIEPVTRVHAMNWVYWTLTYEIAFYVVVAIALGMKTCFRQVLLTVTAISVLPSLHEYSPLFFLKHWGIFALGLSMASALRAPRKAIALFSFSIVSIAVNQDKATDAAALLMLFLGSSRWIKNPTAICGRLAPLKSLGKISYTLYLTHVPLGIYVFGRIWNIRSRGPLEAVVVTDILITCCCASTAWFVWYFIERPSRKSVVACSPGVPQIPRH